jgi:peptidase E
VELHLFSSADPERDLEWALKVCRERLRDKSEATVAYLPLASLFTDRWLTPTQKAFKGLAHPEVINPEMMQLSEMEGVLRRAALAYIPGGNAFLLNHRLHASGLMPYLRKKVRNGLPVVAVGAGAVVCGPNILTSNDLNLLPTPHFDSLDVSPFNFHVGYVDDAFRDAWLADYHSFHDNPIILLEDEAYLKIEGRKTNLVRGNAWCWRAGAEKETLTVGNAISPN